MKKHCCRKSKLSVLILTRKFIMNRRFYFRKRIERLDTAVSRNVQIIATMRHEMDILSSHRASLKAIETENAELKSKMELMLSIETVLTASQSEVEEILRQKLNAKDLSVMVGTLRRELKSNETRKHELKKQLQMIKNDLRAEQEERRKLQDKVNFYESENHEMKNRLRRLESMDKSCGVIESSDTESPEPAKRPRLALKYLNELNTPSPLSHVSFSIFDQNFESHFLPLFRTNSITELSKSKLQIPPI